MKMTIWFLFNNLLIWCITLTDLQVLKNPCIPEFMGFPGGSDGKESLAMQETRL